MRNQGYGIRRQMRWAWALLALSWCAAACAQQMVQPKDEKEEEIEYYKNVRSYVDQTPFELGWELPELVDLEPRGSRDEGQQVETRLLAIVGQNVKEFVEHFPGVVASEEITMQQLWHNGKAAASKTRRFRYVMIREGDGNRSRLHEYRTDLEGKAEDPWGLYKGFRPTTGFASTVVAFHPLARSDALFGYLGKEILGGKETEVMAFAQRPGLTQVAGRVELGKEKSIRMLLQGVAWIDPATCQIVRLRTDLLAPLVEAGLTRYTTEVSFREVRPGAIPSPLWLPVEATVTTERRGVIYRNIHRFSDYAPAGH